MIETIIGLLGLSAIAIEIAYHSDLAYQLKTALFMTEDKLQKISILCSTNFWAKFLPWYLWWMILFIVIFMYGFGKFVELINCPFCTGFWVALGYLLLNDFTILAAIPLTGITIIAVYLIQAVAKYVG